jgi:hypothetical protein
MQAMIFLVLGIVPPVVAGPLAGWVYLEILKHGKGWYLIPFWVLLAVLNLLIIYWVVSPSGVWLSISSLAAFFATPFAAIITVLLMRRVWKKLAAAAGTAAPRRRWYLIGLVLIPLLQIGMFVALLFAGPQLCKAGLVVCKGL